MENLQNKNVLIIGATGGIGVELVPLLKKSLANVYITGRNKATLEHLAAANNIPSSQIFELDITDYEAVNRVAATIHGTIPQVDILINAAGIGIIKSIENLDYEDFNKTIDVNLKGTFHLLKAFLPPMKVSKTGLIVNMPGVLGKTPMAGSAAYSASKYGMNGMLKSVREELKRTNIRITNIYTGGTDTHFWDNIDLPVQRDKFITAQEVARAVWFLCQQPKSGVVSEMVLQPFNHQAI